MNFDIKNPENLKGVDLIWIFEVLETLLGTQNWGISNLCSSGCKLGKPDSADKRGPLSAKERKEKKKKRKKKKGAGARFRFFIKPDKRDPRSATLAHVSRDQAKTSSPALKQDAGQPKNDTWTRCKKQTRISQPGPRGHQGGSFKPSSHNPPWWGAFVGP